MQVLGLNYDHRRENWHKKNGEVALLTDKKMHIFFDIVPMTFISYVTLRQLLLHDYVTDKRMFVLSSCSDLSPFPFHFSFSIFCRITSLPSSSCLPAQLPVLKPTMQAIHWPKSHFLIYDFGLKPAIKGKGENNFMTIHFQILKWIALFLVANILSTFVKKKVWTLNFTGQR